jgi:hypothetical protein
LTQQKPVQVSLNCSSARHSARYEVLPTGVLANRGLACCARPDGNQQDLADAPDVGIVTIHQLEAGTSEPRRATLQVIRHAFEAAGVEFIEENVGGPGVRLRKPPKLKR